MNKDNINRELDKVEQALTFALEHLQRQSEANAALHMTTRVMYSPLASSVFSAIQSLEVIRNELV